MIHDLRRLALKCVPEKSDQRLHGFTQIDYNRIEDLYLGYLELEDRITYRVLRITAKGFK